MRGQGSSCSGRFISHWAPVARARLAGHTPRCAGWPGPTAGPWSSHARTERKVDTMSVRFPEVPETLFGLNKRLVFISEALKALGDPSVLDIGCGTGEFVTLPLARQGW